jgi:hypothetical protein
MKLEMTIFMIHNRSLDETILKPIKQSYMFADVKVATS